MSIKDIKIHLIGIQNEMNDNNKKYYDIIEKFKTKNTYNNLSGTLITN